MLREYVAPGLVIVLALAIMAQALAERWRAVDRRHYDGRVAAAATAVAGPLRAELRAAEYARGVARVAGGRSDLRLAREPGTRLDLWLRNDGAAPLAVPAGSASGSAMPGGCYVLVDDRGRHYPAVGANWERRPGEPDHGTGWLLAGWGVAVAVEFPGIPVGARALTLRLDCVAVGDEPLGPLDLAVPLP